MKMATDNLSVAAEQRVAARQKYIDERVKPAPNDFNSLNEAHLVSLVKELHKQLNEAEESRYDYEMRIRKQDYDVNLFFHLTNKKTFLYFSRLMN
jgi:hypothetical protein